MSREERIQHITILLEEASDEVLVQMEEDLKAQVESSSESVHGPLTPELKEILRISQEEGRNGDFYTHEQVMREAKEWLKEEK